MDTEYVKETNKTEAQKDRELIQSLVRTKMELQTATKNFEQQKRS